MGNPTLDEIIKAWCYRTEQDSPLKMTSICLRAIRFLAEGEPVSPEQFALASQMVLDEVKNSFNALKNCGAEFDAEGNLVGVVLTLNPTSHQFYVDGHNLYAWCALDAIFLPALLGQTAAVKSKCPATDVDIRLMITPEGIGMVSPPDTVLSVVIPGVTPSCQPGVKSGPQGPLCSAIHFFSAYEAASTWLVEHPGMAILSLDETWQLAREVWIKPYC